MGPGKDQLVKKVTLAISFMAQYIKSNKIFGLNFKNKSQEHFPQNNIF